MTTLLEGPLPDLEEATGLAPGADLVQERRARGRQRLRHLATSAAGVTAAVVVWEVVALIVHDQVILPSVPGTAQTLWHYLGRPYPTAGDPLWEDALVSTARVVTGFAIGSLAGVALGALMVAVRPIRHFVDPLIELTRPLPPLAFIPLLILWFGIGETPKIVLIVIGVLPVMVVSTVSGLRTITPELELCARTLGASRRYTLWHVQVRAAMPAIVTGMRISMAGAWTSIVAAEMIAATSGLGYLILQASNYLQTPLVFTGIISIGLIGLMIDGTLRATLRWADPARR